MLVVLFASCQTKAAGIVFTDGSRPPVELRQDRRPTPLYTLVKPVTVTSAGRSFFLVYRSGGSAEAELRFASGKSVYFRIPSMEGELLHYQFPVPRGKRIAAFRVTGTVGAGAGSGVTVTGCGLEETASGFHMRKTEGKRVVYLQEGMNRISPLYYTFTSLSRGAANRFHQAQIGFTYSYSGQVPSSLSLTLTGEGKVVHHRIIVRPGGSQLYFYSDEEGMIPEGLSVTDAPVGFHLTSLTVKPFSRYVPVSYKPIPADLGVILRYKEASWRRNDFELFSWTLFPDFLLIDFRSYALQSAFLKRLAFFLEKKGYAGRLLTNDELAPLHGWNAHDYRAEDLALFFNTAAASGFHLNPEEYLLSDILLANHVLKKIGTRFVPVSGGFLSFTQESSPRLRYLFITHEGYHGVFFSSPRYRQAVQTVWDGLSPVEQSFWREFLDWKGYNIQDPYLVVNEFQAYLMQQKLDRVNHYYKEYIIPKLDHFFPGRKGEMESFLAQYPDHFISSAEKIQAAVSRIKGITAGELRCVVE